MATILVVDDSPLIRSLVVAALSRINIQVHEAASGATAMQMCANECIDLVVLDMELEDTNGLEVCAQLKGRPATAHLPVILMSGHGPDVFNRLDVAHAPDFFLPKPFSLHDIQQLVRNAIKPA